VFDVVQILLLQLHHLPAAGGGCVSVLACCCLQELQLQLLLQRLAVTAALLK
jgi:hypothetical protein